MLSQVLCLTFISVCLARWAPQRENYIQRDYREKDNYQNNNQRVEYYPGRYNDQGYYNNRRYDFNLDNDARQFRGPQNYRAYNDYRYPNFREYTAPKNMQRNSLRTDDKLPELKQVISDQAIIREVKPATEELKNVVKDTQSKKSHQDEAISESENESTVSESVNFNSDEPAKKDEAKKDEAKKELKSEVKKVEKDTQSKEAAPKTESKVETEKDEMKSHQDEAISESENDEAKKELESEVNVKLGGKDFIIKVVNAKDTSKEESRYENLFKDSKDDAIPEISDKEDQNKVVTPIEVMQVTAKINTTDEKKAPKPFPEEDEVGPKTQVKVTQSDEKVQEKKDEKVAEQKNQTRDGNNDDLMEELDNLHENVADTTEAKIDKQRDQLRQMYYQNDRQDPRRYKDTERDTEAKIDKQRDQSRQMYYQNDKQDPRRYRNSLRLRDETLQRQYYRERDNRERLHNARRQYQLDSLRHRFEDKEDRSGYYDMPRGYHQPRYNRENAMKVV